MPVSAVRTSDPYRKATIRLILLLMLCYVAAFLDRVNVGFAKLTMLGDLGFSEAAYGFGAGLFFFGYFLFETPSNLLMHRIGARLTLSRIMILWGLISAAFAFVQTEWHFYTLRFLLGAAEAGFYPGVILYLTYWFPAVRRARVVALFICAIPLAGLIGGPLSGTILAMSMRPPACAAGKGYFCSIEALPSLILGLVVLVCLDDSPAKARWLTAEEKTIIENDLRADVPASSKTVGLSGVLSASSPCSLSSPSAKRSGNMACPSGCRRSSRRPASRGRGHRHVQCHPVRRGDRMHAADSTEFGPPERAALAPRRAVSGGAFGLAASTLFTGDVTASLIALCVAAAGCYTVTALFWILPPLYLTGVEAAAGIAVINSVGAIAGFVSPFAVGWIRETTQSTNGGMLATSAFMILGAILTLLLPTWKGERS